ncbi:MAG: hypothetical protein Q9201_002661 [Fulgogasparrea decipioides]
MKLRKLKMINNAEYVDRHGNNSNRLILGGSIITLVSDPESGAETYHAEGKNEIVNVKTPLLPGRQAV